MRLCEIEGCSNLGRSKSPSSGGGRERFCASHRANGLQRLRDRDSKRMRNLLIIEDEKYSRGGSCEVEDCEFSAILMWHHRIPSSKLFNVTTGLTIRSIAALQCELGKCDLLCPNHHALAHLALASEPAPAYPIVGLIADCPGLLTKRPSTRSKA